MRTRETILSKQEKEWLLEKCVNRLTDDREVQIYPMGAEKYLYDTLLTQQENRYNINADINNKHVLVIPGHGNSGFIFAQAGAKSITVYDKDPVTIAWMKAFKKYYHYREYVGSTSYPSIGELMSALTSWYPPLIFLPFGKLSHILFWSIHPNTLRRVYIHYMLSLVQQALKSNLSQNFELNKNIQFLVGTIEKIRVDKIQDFDTVFVPYLLGVENGIEKQEDIVNFIRQLILLLPNSRILVTPCQDTKEFYITGKRYFKTTTYSQLQAIPGLSSHAIKADASWFRKQGLVVFGSKAS